MPNFVIQIHRAKKLHWDFRIELDGVLKSWAVPKEPPKEKGIKRLAIMVEDHDLSYANFEGTIPEGSYGAGTVKIWDSGSYELKERKKSELIFVLHGKKLNGEYVLLKLKPSTKFKGKNNWLFFRKRI
ncbi:MAG: DNA polymerase ligase N-terminal domain-containing protein [Candidatus Aenigmatarchaeota archaeon]